MLHFAPLLPSIDVSSGGNSRLGTLASVITSPFATSETSTINAVDIFRLGQLCTLCDTPGFFDNRSVELSLANGIGMARSLKKCSSIRPVFVIGGDGFEHRLDGLVSLCAVLASLFKDIGSNLKSFNFLFTRGLTEKDYENCEARFRDKALVVNDPVRSLLNEIAAKIREHKKLLLVDPLNNDGSSLLQLILDTNPIEDPGAVVQEFIPGALEEKLNRQLKLHHSSISNAMVRFDQPLLSHKLDELLKLQHITNSEACVLMYQRSVDEFFSYLQRISRSVFDKLESYFELKDSSIELSEISTLVKSILCLEDCRAFHFRQSTIQLHQPLREVLSEYIAMVFKKRRVALFADLDQPDPHQHQQFLSTERGQKKTHPQTDDSSKLFPPTLKLLLVKDQLDKLLQMDPLLLGSISDPHLTESVRKLVMDVYEALNRLYLNAENHGQKLLESKSYLEMMLVLEEMVCFTSVFESHLNLENMQALSKNLRVGYERAVLVEVDEYLKMIRSNALPVPEQLERYQHTLNELYLICQHEAAESIGILEFSLQQQQQLIQATLAKIKEQEDCLESSELLPSAFVTIAIRLRNINLIVDCMEISEEVFGARRGLDEKLHAKISSIANAAHLEQENLLDINDSNLKPDCSKLSIACQHLHNASLLERSDFDTFLTIFLGKIQRAETSQSTLVFDVGHHTSVSTFANHFRKCELISECLSWASNEETSVLDSEDHRGSLLFRSFSDRKTQIISRSRDLVRQVSSVLHRNIQQAFSRINLSHTRNSIQSALNTPGFFRSLNLDLAYLAACTGKAKTYSFNFDEIDISSVQQLLTSHLSSLETRLASENPFLIQVDVAPNFIPEMTGLLQALQYLSYFTESLPEGYLDSQLFSDWVTRLVNFRKCLFQTLCQHQDNGQTGKIGNYMGLINSLSILDEMLPKDSLFQTILVKFEAELRLLHNSVEEKIQYCEFDEELAQLLRNMSEEERNRYEREITQSLNNCSSSISSNLDASPCKYSELFENLQRIHAAEINFPRCRVDQRAFTDLFDRLYSRDDRPYSRERLSSALDDSNFPQVQSQLSFLSKLHRMSTYYPLKGEESVTFAKKIFNQFIEDLQSTMENARKHVDDHLKAVLSACGEISSSGSSPESLILKLPSSEILTKLSHASRHGYFESEYYKGYYSKILKKTESEMIKLLDAVYSSTGFVDGDHVKVMQGKEWVRGILQNQVITLENRSSVSMAELESKYYHFWCSSAPDSVLSLQQSIDILSMLDPPLVPEVIHKKFAVDVKDCRSRIKHIQDLQYDQIENIHDDIAKLVSAYFDFKVFRNEVVMNRVKSLLSDRFSELLQRIQDHSIPLSLCLDGLKNTSAPWKRYSDDQNRVKFHHVADRLVTRIDSAIRSKSVFSNPNLLSNITSFVLFVEEVGPDHVLLTELASRDLGNNLEIRCRSVLNRMITRLVSTCSVCREISSEMSAYIQSATSLKSNWTARLSVLASTIQEIRGFSSTILELERFTRKTKHPSVLFEQLTTFVIPNETPSLSRNSSVEFEETKTSSSAEHISGLHHTYTIPPSEPLQPFFSSVWDDLVTQCLSLINISDYTEIELNQTLNSSDKDHFYKKLNNALRIYSAMIRTDDCGLIVTDQIAKIVQAAKELLPSIFGNEVIQTAFNQYIENIRSISEIFEIPNLRKRAESARLDLEESFRCHVVSYCEDLYLPLDLSGLHQPEFEASISRICDKLIVLKAIGETISHLKSVITKCIDNLFATYEKQKSGLEFIGYIGTTLFGREMNYATLLLRDHPSLSAYSDYIFNEKFSQMTFEKMVCYLSGTDIDIEALEIAFFSLKGHYEASIKSGLPFERRSSFLNLTPSGVRELIERYQRHRNEYERRDLLLQIIATVLSYWTISKASNYDKLHKSNRSERFQDASLFLIRPHTGQMISILRLLGVGSSSPRSLQNHLAQLRTGEGKSVVLAVVSTVLALLGHEVHCVCYSEYLSSRDYGSFAFLFEAFQVKSYITYGTFNQLCEKFLNEQGSSDIRSQVSTVLTGSIPGTTASIQVTGRDRVLLIDEVDVFFSNQFLGRVYVPLSRIQSDQISSLLRLIWEEGKTRSDHSDLLSSIQATPEYSECLRVHASWTLLLEECIYNMITDRLSFGSHEYICEEGKIFYFDGDKKTDSKYERFKTIFAYFQEFEQNNVTDIELSSRLCIPLVCGSFAYSEIPGRYLRILGVTGTLQSLNSVQDAMLRDKFKITSRTYIPSVYGESKLKERPIRIFPGSRYYNEIIDSIQTEVDQGRAVLVFFPSFDLLERFRDSPEYKRLYRVTQVLSESTKEEHRESIVREAVKSKSITLVTKQLGRGTDFICSNTQVNQAGGVHVIQTYLSMDQTEEIQIKGRTARQGENGSFEIILLDTDLEVFGIQGKDEIAALDSLRNDQLRAYLDKKCTEKLSEMSLETLSFVDKSLPLHEKSLDFCIYLKNASMENIVPFLVDMNQSHTTKYSEILTRTVCLIDATGSMHRTLHAVKVKVVDMFTEVLATLQAAEVPGRFELMVGVYRSYNSYHPSLDKLFLHSSWTAEPDVIQDFLSDPKCNAMEGDMIDGFEAIEVALQFVNDHRELCDNTTQVILIGDMPPCKTLDDVRAKRKRNAFLESSKYSQETWWEAECEKLAARQIPVQAFYVNRFARNGFSKIAEATGGVAKELDMRSESGADILKSFVCESLLKNIGELKGGDSVSRQLVTKYKELFPNTGYI